jgi:ABC-type molybdate transport system substrate-binding protein
LPDRGACRNFIRILAALLLATAVANSARADDKVKIFAAGSLREAFTEIAAAYKDKGGADIDFTFGPAGLLRERIEHGERADLFASANMAHPQALADAGRGGAVVRFTRNALCAITKPGAGFTTDTLVARMLDPNVKLGIFTPGADPSGDYALAVFGRVDALRPGAGATLKAKAKQLLGGREAPKVPAGQNPIAYHLGAGDADLFLGYCTIGKGSSARLFETVTLPDSISVAADYGLIVLHEAAATRLAQFILSGQGQAILAKFGFAPR